VRFFTPQLYVRSQSEEEDVLNETEQLWQDAVQRYDAQLQALLPVVPGGVRELFGNYHLHDADVLAFGQQGDCFFMLVQLDPPYRTLILTYTLTEPAWIDRSALPPQYTSPHPEWLYDEVDVVQKDPAIFEHAILLSNGYELRLHFRDLQLSAFRSLLLTELQRRRADESERLGAFLQSQANAVKM
jgi:hypothetical protein